MARSARKTLSTRLVTVATVGNGASQLAPPIADLAGEENVSATHLSETIQYRRLDRSL
jgi:predicted ATPase with chaperone activity